MSNFNFENINYDNNLYYPRDTVNYLVRSTHSSSTSSWTGNLPVGISSCEDGLTIDYFLNQDPTSTAATLNLGGTGAKPVLLGNNNNAVSDQFPKYSVLRLTYIEAAGLNNGNGVWKVSAYSPGSGGTVNSVASGDGLTGGPITNTGTLKANLRSYTKLVNDSVAAAENSERIYPVVLDKTGYLAVNVPWTDVATVKQDGVRGSTGNHYALCSTAAGTAIKTASITSGTPVLETGLRIVVKFTNTNTSDNPQLNINSLGAKNIYHNGEQITTGETKSLLSGVVEFIYDGNQWQFVGNYVNTTGIFALNLTENNQGQITPSQTFANTIAAINHGDAIDAKYIGSLGETVQLDYVKQSNTTIVFCSPIMNGGRMQWTFTSSGVTASDVEFVPNIEIVDWTTNTGSAS